MRVQLDRGKKIVLIKALKAGYIDSDDVGGWFDRSTLTDEELERELTHLQMALYPDTCRRLKGAGLCVDCNRSGGVVVNGVRLPKDTEEIPD